MYQIGLFSKMNHVTVKTLHHYEEIGLLKPDRVDGETGYRYYSLGQSYRLHRITALKQIGFSLEDIKSILEGKSKGGYLYRKKAELLHEIAENTKKLAQVEYYLSQEDSEPMEGYEVLVKEIPDVFVASLRTVASSPEEFFRIIPKMGEAMAELGCVCAIPEYCFNIYHDGEYKEKNIDIEICEAVTKLQPDAKGLSFKTMPKIPQAACLFHKGGYETLPKAYLALTLWVENNGYQLVDLPRESYLDGVWNKENKDEWLTEIQFPITEITEGLMNKQKRTN